MDDVLPVFEQYLENRLTFVTRKNAIVIFNGNHRGALQAVVRAVADGTALTCLAAAKLHPLCALRHVKNRLKAGSVVRAVAKRLRRTAAAGAPFIGFTFLNIDHIGKRLCHDGIGHACAPCSDRQFIAALYRRYPVNGRFVSIESDGFCWRLPRVNGGIDLTGARAHTNWRKHGRPRPPPKPALRPARWCGTFRA